MASKNINNKQNAEDQTQDDVDKIVDFLPKYKIMQSEFDKAIVRELYSENGKRLKGKQQSWPRLKETDERIYEMFMARVSNPVTNTFYPQKDSDGRIIKPKDNCPNCRYYVQSIFRIRTTSGEEFLYSTGLIRGYDVAGSEVHEHISKPESYIHTVFDMERIYDNDTKTFYENCHGPIESYEEYSLPFSPENVDLLYEKRDKSRNAKPVNFYVKDEQSGMDVSVRWSLVQDTVKLFKEKDFVFLFNGQYIPTAIKEEMRQRTDALTGEQNIGPATNPSTNFNYHNNNDSSNSTKDINAYS